jgi:DNA polymerase-3 subunit alpha
MMKVVVVLWIMLKKVWCKSSGSNYHYGKMATKSAPRYRSCTRFAFEADRIAKLIPAMMPSKWNLALSESEDEVKKALKSSEEFDKIKELIGIANEDDLAGETIQQAKILEGSMRNTGIHACGVIITPSDITNYAKPRRIDNQLPVQTAKDGLGPSQSQRYRYAAKSKAPKTNRIWRISRIYLSAGKGWLSRRKNGEEEIKLI